MHVARSATLHHGTLSFRASVFISDFRGSVESTEIDSRGLFGHDLGAVMTVGTLFSDIPHISVLTTFFFTFQLALLCLVSKIADLDLG